MTRRTIAALVCSLALVGPQTGCSNADTQEEAESAVCTSLAEVKTAAAGVKSLDANSTVDEVKAAQEALGTAIAGLRANAAELNEADLAALEAAGDEIEKAVSDVSGSDTLGEASASIQSSSTALEAAVTEMENGVQCK
jgi:hypothetical protein